MKSRLGIGLSVLALIACVWWWSRLIDEPAHAGRTWSAWLEILVASVDEKQTEEAREAFRAMGRPVAPYLAKVFSRDEGPLGRTYGLLYAQLPSQFQEHLPDPNRRRRRRSMAGFALAQLGSNIVEVLPVIARVTDQEAVLQSTMLLARTTPGTHFETNAFQMILQRAQSQDSEVASGAIGVLWRFTNQIDHALSILIPALSGPVEYRAPAMRALQRIGKPAVPALIDAASREHGLMRVAGQTLERIDPAAAHRARNEPAERSADSNQH